MNNNGELGGTEYARKQEVERYLQIVQTKN